MAYNMFSTWSDLTKQHFTKHNPQLYAFDSQICIKGRDKIIDVVARSPGSTHDSRMLRISGLYQLI